MNTKTTKAPAPAYANAPAQYSINNRGMSIECTGYLESLKAAKAFARARYGKSPDLTVSAVYPAQYRDGVQHAV